MGQETSNWEISLFQYPENIPICTDIDLIIIVMIGFGLRIERVYFHQKKHFAMKLLRLSEGLFAAGVGLNVIQILLRYGLRSGAYTMLWHRGLDCFYVTFIVLVVYFIRVCFEYRSL